LRVTDRLGKGIRTPARDAIIADATPAELHGRAFGLQRGLDNAGAVLGPLAAWALLTTGTLDVPGVIAASIVPGVLVLGLAVVAVRGARTRAVIESHAAAAGKLRLPLPVALVAAFSLFRLPEALMLLHAQRLGVPVAAVTLLWAAVHVATSAASFVGGAVNDRLGSPRALGLGWIVYALLAAGFGFADAVWQAWALFLGLGFVVGFMEGPERALVARLGAGRQGSAFGTGLGVGLLYQTVGPLAACLTSAGGVLVLWGAWSRVTKV